MTLMFLMFFRSGFTSAVQRGHGHTPLAPSGTNIGFIVGKLKGEVEECVQSLEISYPMA